MNILGIDYGLKRIGLSLSTDNFAYPLPTLEVSAKKSALTQIITILQRNRVEKIVFGLPLPDRIGVAKFATSLEELTSVKIVFRDETYSSKTALEKLKQSGRKRIGKKEIDALSAVLLLQEELDEHPE